MAGQGGMKRRALRAAFPHTVPILTGFLFLGMTYGVYMSSLGFSWIYPTMMALMIYAGSMEFVTANMLLGAFNPLQAFAMTLMVNARHLFYGLSYIERFSRMGRLRPYMVFSLTDETYSVFCGLPGEESDGVMVRVALYDQLYWVAGSIVGAMLASSLPVDLTGIDFSMTALFIVICVERARERGSRAAMAVGATCALVSLALLGPEHFLAPALAATALVLTVADVVRKEAAP